MAAVTLLGTQTFSTPSGTKTVTATPAAGDLIFIVTAHTGNTSAAAPTDDQSGGTYTSFGQTAVKNTSGDTLKFWIRDALVTSAVQHVFTHAPGGSTGGGLAVLKVTGMTKFGTSARRVVGGVSQTFIQNNQTGTAAPSITFNNAVLTTNPVISAVLNVLNPSNITAPSGFVRLVNDGYNTPTSGLAISTIDSGHSSATVTWGSNAATDWCAMTIELDASKAYSLSALGVG